MKKFFAILIVALLATSFAFADVNDNTEGATKIGTGSFSCTVLTPLKVTGGGIIELGDFVGGEAPGVVYTDFTNSVITFNVTGEIDQDYYFTTEVENLTPLVATFEGTWDEEAITAQPRNLGTSGATTHTYTLSKLTALASGDASLDLTLTVSYNF